MHSGRLSNRVPCLCRWRRWVGLAAMLTCLGWPAGVMASAPTVSNNAVTVNIGSYVLFYLSASTTWTGDVATLSYYVLTTNSCPTNTINTPHAFVFVDTIGGWCEYWLNNGQYAGTDSFAWCAANGSETSGLATCAITISNDVPKAASSTCSIVGTNLPNPLANLTALVTHADYNQTMTYAITTAPTNGTASLVYTNYNYWLCYTPNPGFLLGADTLYWTVSDGISTSAPAQLTIILGTNNVPVANPVFCTATSGVRATPLFTPSTNYTHPDIGQTISYLVATPATYGTASMDPTSGYIDYLPAPLFAGTDTFQWAVSDGVSTSAPALVTVTVLPSVPVPTNQTLVICKNMPVTFTPSFSGGGGYTCWLPKAIWVTIVGGAGSGGTLVSTNGMHFRYTPKTDLVGPVYFQWSIIYSNATTPVTTTAVATCSIVVKDASTNADWAQWRFDECRTAQTPMTLPDPLYLQWRRDLPTCAGAFDAFGSSYPGDKFIDICRPVQLGKSLFVSCLANDSVSAYDTDTGMLKWRYYAGGALRRPPAAVALPNGTNVVIFGCDDGMVYCLNAANGAEYWKFQAAINSKKAMGFGRLGSVWPVWASPVVYSNRVYFAAGYVPTWSVWAYCLDIASGSVVWRNDGRMMKLGNHASQTSTLGPLALSADHSTIYGSTEGRSRVWYVSTSSGELTGIAGRNDPGNGTTGHDGDNLFWYVDGTGANKQFEPMSLVAGSRTVVNTDVAAWGVPGTISSMLAGDGKLFVTTLDGSIYCFGASHVTPTIYANTVTPLLPTNDVWTSAVQSMLTNRADLAQGLALVWGVGSGRLVEELATQAPGLMVVAVDSDTNKLLRLRREMDAAGWSGKRVSTIQGYPMTCGFAPYQAALIASEDVSVAGFTNGAAMAQMLYKCTRPFGGEIWLATSNAQHAAIAGWLAAATNLILHDAVPSYDVQQRTGFAGLGTDGFTQIRRLGLPDADLVLRPPFRLIAFGPTRGSLPVSSTGMQKGQKDSSYDIYSWLPETAPMTGYEPAALLQTNSNSHADGPVPGPAVRNVLHGFIERTPDLYVPNQINCEGTVAYGNATMGSGKVGYFRNASNYWGTLVFPEIGGCAWGGGTLLGNGVAAYATYEACICVNCFAYTQFGFVSSDDPCEEYWVNYQLGRSVKETPETPVRKIGVNFGAPGDMYVPEEQMLWTHHPTFGRGADWTMVDALPLLPVRYRGSNVKSVYHHTSQMAQTPGPYRGWVASSCVSGMSGMTIPLASPLVAYRTTTPPALDGVLNDSCWTNQVGVEMPIDLLVLNNSMGTQEVTSAGTVKLSYDDTNLYIAAGIRAPQIPMSTYIYMALNSREQKVSPVLLMHCINNPSYPKNAPTKASTGIGTNAWTVAATTNATPPYVYQEEIAIAWSALAAAGLWKSQLVMNVEISRSFLNVPPGPGYIPWTVPNKVNSSVANRMSPVYLDAPRGAVTNATPHTVRLHFAEMEGMTNGQRVFDVQLQGQTVLTNLDVVAQAGGPRRELMKEFQNVTIADHLDIDFPNATNAPMLSGVEIIDTQTNAYGNYITPPNLPPVAIITASATNGPAPLNVSFSAQGSYDPDGQIVECVWETGDGRLARGSLLNHIFAEPGTYAVNLLVLDNGGATAVTNIQVTVSAGLPSAFVCNIRSNGLPGCDYTNLTTWNTAIAGDLTSSTRLFNLSSLGSYATTDKGQGVLLPGGLQGTIQWVATNVSPKIMALAIGSTPAYTVFHVSSKGSYNSRVDDGQGLAFPGGPQGTLLWVATNVSPMIAAVTGISGTGTLAVGTVQIPHNSDHPPHTNTFTISDAGVLPGYEVGTAQVLPVNQGHTFTISNTGSAAQSLLFTVSGRESYATNDDGGTVLFTGGGLGTLRHINASNIAYITECRGTIQAGRVTCTNSTHTFTIADTGNPIVTAVAQCYHDWPNGLVDAPQMGGYWVADGNHCATIRPAPGQGHAGNLKGTNGNYAGFTLKGTLDASGAAYARIEKIADDGYGITIGAGGSVNRVLDIGTLTAGGNGGTIANSIATLFAGGSTAIDLSFYNCTARAYTLCDYQVYSHRAVNCLAWTNGTGFGLQLQNNPVNAVMYWLNHCVSADGSATNHDTWLEGNTGNQANTSVTFANAASHDYHLAVTDTGARAKGMPGLGADISGVARTGPPYDVGAAQSLSAPAGNPPQLQSGPTATPNPVATNAVVQFTFSATDSNVLTNYWTFGDGTIGAPQPAFVTNHIYNAIGTYTAQVAISDGTLATTGTVVVNVLSGFAMWQTANFGSTNAPGSASNTVNSAGISNYQLFLAGSNPANPGTWFLFTGITPSTGNGCGLNFNTVSGKSYTVTWKTNLLDGLGWQFYTNFGSSGGPTNVAFPAGLPNAFFQIQAQ